MESNNWISLVEASIERDLEKIIVIESMRRPQTGVKDTLDKIQVLLTEQLNTPDPLTYKEFYKELMILRKELMKKQV